jgi:uncharacterized membrane protein YgdD (TMEM256/DUF423 family)
MTISNRRSVLVASLLGLSGVALGAFGAHALKESLAANGTAAIWQTAVSYQLLHAVALLALANRAESEAMVRWTGRCWVGGVALFSGSLYALALGGPKILGPITPLGGLALLAGWSLLAWNAFRQPNA